MRLKYFPILLGSMISLNALAQKAQPIQISLDAASQKATIKVNGKLFTAFNYPDSLEKPFLYPILASNEKTITRGFPLNPQPGDPTDHPHHIGLWMNYESVNGLDFWNNSYAIAAEKKSHYGWVRTRKIGGIKSGTKGQLSYEADWHNQAKTVLLNEATSFEFSATENQRIIDRTTTLTAQETVLFADIKDGFLGLRVAHELELPVLETKKYTDASGIVTTVKATKDKSVTGNYLASNGKQGEAVWATRANWCMLYGKQGTDSTSVVIIDHPSNPGFPTYWHARNYGLFAANPLGQKIFSNGKEALNLQLEKGQSVIFKYRIVIAIGKTRLSNDQIQVIEKQFQQVK
jgi:hypothetical protein